MYQRDQSAIGSFIDAGAPGWENRAASAYMLVGFTIKNLTPGVLGHLQAFLRDGDSAQTFTFPTRRQVLQHIRSNGHMAPLRAAHGAIVIGAPEHALVALCGMPWLGYAKAGFLLQLIWGDAGCVDSRNQKYFNVAVGKYSAKLSYPLQVRDAYAYLQLCRALGGSEHLWNTWCAGVSAQWPATYPTADDVSALHVTWLDIAHRALWRPGAASTASTAPGVAAASNGAATSPADAAALAAMLWGEPQTAEPFAAPGSDVALARRLARQVS